MNKYTFNVFFKLLSRKKILCIGDIILDNFIDNEIVKLSDEDPIHVINGKSSNYKLGGVGNVALNLANAGAKIKLVTVKPFGITSAELRSKIPKIFNTFNENKYKKNKKDNKEIITPVIKTNLKGIREKDTKPSKATALAPKKE